MFIAFFSPHLWNMDFSFYIGKFLYWYHNNFTDFDDFFSTLVYFCAPIHYTHAIVFLTA